MQVLKLAMNSWLFPTVQGAETPKPRVPSSLITETMREVGIQRPGPHSPAAWSTTARDLTNSLSLQIQHPTEMQQAGQRGFVNIPHLHDATEPNLIWLQGLKEASDCPPFHQSPCNLHGHRQTHHCESQQDGRRSRSTTCTAITQWPIWLLKQLVKLWCLVSGGSCQIHSQFLI